MAKMTIKERIAFFIKKRWIYGVSLLITYGVPLILICEKLFTVEQETVTRSVSVSFGGMVLGLIYLVFAAKKVKAKIDRLEPGAAKICFNGLHNCIPFATAGFIFYIIEKALVGADITAWCICVSMIAGMAVQLIDWGINHDYLYAREIDSLAKKAADIEYRKNQLIEERRAQEEEESV